MRRRHGKKKKKRKKGGLEVVQSNFLRSQMRGTNTVFPKKLSFMRVDSTVVV